MIDEKKLSLFRKYTFECVLFGLTTCVIYLFVAYQSLNEFIRQDLVKQNNKQIQVVEENSNILNRFQNTLDNYNFIKTKKQTEDEKNH